MKSTPTTQYSDFDGPNGLDTLSMDTPLQPNEMRIWFMGTMIPPVRRAHERPDPHPPLRAVGGPEVEAVRWHTESFGFQGTRLSGYHLPTRRCSGLSVDPVPVGDDDPHDAHALVPIELDWTNSGRKPGDNVACHNRANFPVADDTSACALDSVRAHVPDIQWSRNDDPVRKNVIWSFGYMVSRLFAGEDRVLRQRAIEPGPDTCCEGGS